MEVFYTPDKRCQSLGDGSVADGSRVGFIQCFLFGMTDLGFVLFFIDPAHSSALPFPALLLSLSLYFAINSTTKGWRTVLHTDTWVGR